MATITDNFLNNIAKAMNNESYIMMDYLAVATEIVTTIDTGATALGGEIGTRIATSGSREDNAITFSAIRSGTDVIDTVNGDTLYTSGMMGTIGSSDLLLGTIHAGISQTTNFDIEFEYSVTFGR